MKLVIGCLCGWRAQVLNPLSPAPPSPPWAHLRDCVQGFLMLT
jgi:hypothetical protein